jgi:hypothetical protein
VELGLGSGEEAVFGWLDRLRIFGLYVAPFAEDDQIMNRLCDASAEYCVKCESEAKAKANDAEAGKEPPKTALRASEAIEISSRHRISCSPGLTLQPPEGPRALKSLDLTAEQQDLLKLLVSKHSSTNGAPFVFVQSNSGSGVRLPKRRYSLHYL